MSSISDHHLLNLRWIIILIILFSCAPVRTSEPVRIHTRVELDLPKDCKDLIHDYITLNGKRSQPDKAIAAFRNVLQQHPAEKDSAIHAVLRCYEAQVWDVIHNGDSMLICCEDANNYLDGHPELIDMRTMSYLYSGWAYMYKKQRLTANYYYNLEGNELEDTFYVKDGSQYYSSDYPKATYVALLTEIAENAENVGLIEQARHYIQRSLYYVSLLGDSIPDLKTYALLDAGLIYTEAQQTDSGAGLFKKALPLLNQLGDTALWIKYYSHRANAANFMHAYDTCIRMFEKALILQKASGAEREDLAITEHGIAAAYLSLGQAPKATAAIKEAIGYFGSDTGIELSERATFSRTYLRYLLAGSPSSKIYEEFLRYYDSLYGMQQINAMSDMNARYGLQKKEGRITRLSHENKSFSERLAAQQTLLLVSLLLIVILGILIALLRQVQTRRRLESERNKAVLEQQLLRSQMEPHFIFNTIAVLQSLVRKDEKERSIRYLSQFARLLRISLENARKALVPLDEEVEALENYLSLQQVRFQNVFQYVIRRFDGFVDEANEVLIPPMLLQPFIENAIQHGMSGKKNNEGLIEIELKKADKVIVCIIIDNGTGVKVKQDLGPKNSLSTIITRERLELLSRQMGTPASLEILNRNANEGGGTLVRLIIPFQRA